METQWLTLLVGLFGLILNTVVLAVSFTWKLSRVETALRKDMIEYRDSLKVEVAREFRLFGESLQALRQKINDVELDAAKTYVRRESWHQAMNQLQDKLNASERADDERALRMEAKMDRLFELFTQGQPPRRER